MNDKNPFIYSFKQSNFLSYHKNNENNLYITFFGWYILLIFSHTSQTVCMCCVVIFFYLHARLTRRWIYHTFKHEAYLTAERKNCWAYRTQIWMVTFLLRTSSRLTCKCVKCYLREEMMVNCIAKFICVWLWWILKKRKKSFISLFSTFLTLHSVLHTLYYHITSQLLSHVETFTPLILIHCI